MFTDYEITLEQLLQARDKRAERQKKLIEKYEVPLITFTVNMPGTRKKTPVSARIFGEGYAELVNKLIENGSHLVYRETHDFITGPEAYIAVKEDERDLKRFLLQIETRHPLGRLFDFDVLGRDGKPISREDMGYLKRKCLLCEQDAHACARSKRHAVHELTERIHSMADSYFK